MKGYKAFDADWTCRGFQYEIGKTYELPESEKLEICKCGFHFCKNPIDVFGYYPMNDNTLIAEIEAVGDIVQEGTKYCTNKIKIVSEFTRDDLQKLIRDGRYNSGCYNSGHFNSGHFNSGDSNSGSSNSGDSNTGDFNSGDFNSGDYNSGDSNSGSSNSGDSNTGNFNSGIFNSGNRNSGIFNSGDYNSGLFNTDEPCMRIFNKSTNIRFTEFLNKIDYDYLEFLLRIRNKELLAEDEKRIRELPNFDAEIFKEITGIDIDEEEKKSERNN